jgi:hypothetical protein
MKGDAAASGRPAAIGSRAPASFDINAETYPFEVVQHLLDSAAFFNLFSIPDTGRASAAITAAGSDSVLTGLRIREILCRFSVHLEQPRAGRPLAAANYIGDPLGRFEQRWMVIPDDYHARPDRVPPPSALDATRPQRFVMLDARCTFGSSDGFRGFGTGTTFPVIHNNRRELLAAAVGTLLEGYGRFQGHEGTYTYCGSLSPDTGFRGNLMVRVMDARGDFRTGGRATEQQQTSLEPGETYIVFRGEKSGRSQRTNFRRDADGRVVGLLVSQQLRALDLDARLGPSSRLESRAEFGPAIGRMSADIDFSLEQRPGLLTPLAPAPFQSLNRYVFEDGSGRTVGALTADGGEGRTFGLQFPAAPGQAALRFGGFGPIIEGSEGLERTTGLMTDNSVVGLAPHALATAYVLRLDDPDGRFRAS